MKKKIVTGTISIGLFLVAMSGIYLVRNHAERANPQSDSGSAFIKVVDVEEVIKAPGQYGGFLGVEGTVITIDESKGIFLLGCQDTCVAMPVKYKGQVPEAKSETIVYGEIRKQKDGKYIFQGKKVKTK